MNACAAAFAAVLVPVLVLSTSTMACAGMVGLAAAALMLEALHMPAMPHMRSVNPYVAPSLEAAAKGGVAQTFIARQDRSLASQVPDSKLTAAVSSFAFQVTLRCVS